MAQPPFNDQDDKKPLDPAVAQIERRVRRLFLIASLTLALGIFAVFAVILYRIVSMEDSAPAPVADPGTAAGESDTAIRSALAAWNAAFNAGDADTICDLFAPDLRYFASGLPEEQTYDDMCARLKGVITDPTRTFSYSLDIREVIVTGDAATVRLTWTLTLRPGGGGEAVTTTEQGMDFFRKQPDGSWKIARFVSYEE